VHARDFGSGDMHCARPGWAVLTHLSDVCDPSRWRPPAHHSVGGQRRGTVGCPCRRGSRQSCQAIAQAEPRVGSIASAALPPPSHQIATAGTPTLRARAIGPTSPKRPLTHRRICSAGQSLGSGGGACRGDPAEASLRREYRPVQGGPVGCRWRLASRLGCAATRVGHGQYSFG